MSQRDEDLPDIDPAILNLVTGGTATDEQISEALKSIQSTLDNLKSNNGNNTNWFQQLLPFLLFASGGSIYGSTGACGCGCGGRGSCRRR